MSHASLATCSIYRVLKVVVEQQLGGGRVLRHFQDKNAVY